MINSSVSTHTSSSDAKYTVADILSSMSNGEVITPSFAEAPALPSYVSGTSAVLTPTTLANIEQSFIELASTPQTSTSTSVVGSFSVQSGFVPPVINPGSGAMNIKSEYEDYDDQDPDWNPPGSKRMRGSEGQVIEISPYDTSAASPASSASPGPRRHTGPRPPRKRDDSLTPDELQKRNVRRERNKMAAAKCRQRRVDLTNHLITETENLEEEKASLENEIQTLQQQREQLEFLLKAHKPMCSAKVGNVVSVVKSEPADGAVAGTSSRPNTLPLVSNVATPTTVNSSVPVTINTNITAATGIVISTPSSGVFATLGLDSMVDGHTGLTPITGGPSCATQAQRNSSDSSPTEALASPTTLMAL